MMDSRAAILGLVGLWAVLPGCAEQCDCLEWGTRVVYKPSTCARYSDTGHCAHYTYGGSYETSYCKKCADSPEQAAAERARLRGLAEQGDDAAQNELGLIYQQGRGVKPDHAEAIKWYRLAAAQGNVDAQNNLGFTYSNSQQFTQDDVEAVRWFRLAAEKGYAMAQNNLGWMYEKGRGVEQDNVQAHMWYSLAAAKGNTLAKESLVGLVEQMSPDEIAEAQRLAQAWKP